MEYKKELVRAGVRLISEGFTVETWGNLSLRDEAGRIYLTPSGMDYDAVTEEDIVVVDARGNLLEGFRRPTTEKLLHLAVYRARPDVFAVVHTHPVYSTVFSCMGEGIPLVTDEAAQALGDAVRVCPYALPGSEALAAFCAEALSGRANACLLKAHGAVCVGRGMKQAFKVARVLEMTAEICWRIRAAGGTPVPLPAENIAAMQRFMAHGYGQPE